MHCNYEMQPRALFSRAEHLVVAFQNCNAYWDASLKMEAVYWTLFSLKIVSIEQNKALIKT